MPSGFPSCSSPGFPGNRLVEAIFPPFFYLNLLDCLIREIVFRAKSFKHLNFQCCISFLILCCCSLNCLMVTANTPWCRGFSSSHQRRLLGFSPRLGSLGAHRCETPSSSGSARQNDEIAVLILGGFVKLYFVFNLPFAWSRFLKHERAKWGDALVEVARLKSDNIALKAFCLFVCLFWGRK